MHIAWFDKNYAYDRNNKLRMRALCPAVRPFKKPPYAPDRGSSTLRETRSDPDFSTP